MVLRSQKIGCVWKTPFRKSGHICWYWPNTDTDTRIDAALKVQLLVLKFQFSWNLILLARELVSFGGNFGIQMLC